MNLHYSLSPSIDRLVSQIGIVFNCRRAVPMIIHSRLLTLAHLAYVIHRLVPALLSILVLKLVEVSLQSLLILQIVLQEYVFLRLRRDESVLHGGSSRVWQLATLSFEVHLLSVLLRSAIFSAWSLTTQMTHLARFNIGLR